MVTPDDITVRLREESQEMRHDHERDQIPVANDGLVCLLEDALEEINTLRLSVTYWERRYANG